MKIALTAAIPEDRLTGDHRVVQTMSLPLGPLYVATALHEVHPDVEIRFFNRWEEITPFHPDILAVGSVTKNCNEARRLAGLAKEQGSITTILGGPHVSALPQALPAEFDYGVI